MGLTTTLNGLKQTFIDGAHDTLRAAHRDWQTVKKGAAVAADGAVDAAYGIGDALEGIVMFPSTTLQHIINGDQTLSDNSLLRTVDTVNHMVYGTLDLVSGHLLYSGAKALGIEQYIPYFRPAPTTVRGMASDLTGVAALFAMPAAGRAAKVRLGIPEAPVPVYETPLARELAAAAQKNAEAVLAKIRVADDALFAMAWQNASAGAAAKGASLGALEVPLWMLPGLNKQGLLTMFRQQVVSNADLEVLVQHADSNVSAAAKLVLVERTLSLAEGYQPIPAMRFKGQEIAPFAMKATPVTNAEWSAPLEGNPNRYVLLRQYPQTLATVVENQGPTTEAVSQALARRVSRINFDQGETFVDGGLVLVKLMDRPSAVFDQSGRLFSAANHPVVGVNYYQIQAWLQGRMAEAGGQLVYRLPTDLEFERVASHGGVFEYGTETGLLYDLNGRKLTHFDEYNNGKGLTAAVDDPRYSQTLPLGVQTTGNVWRWMQADRAQSYPFGLRGGSWSYGYPKDLRAAFRNFSLDPGYRFKRVGFSPVVVVQDSLK